MFGIELPHNQLFVDKVTNAYLALRDLGAKQTVKNLTELFSTINATNNN